MTQALPTYERLHQVFDYKDGHLVRKDTGLQTGHVHLYGYVKIRLDNKTYMEHRLIWKMFNKDFETGTLDHINNNRSDNRIENLRIASRAENNRNAVLRKDNTSGVKGVNWNKRDMRWTASIMVDGKRKALGNFKDLALATEFVQLARDMVHGDFANHGLTV
jgi:hypothetical protein